MTDFKAFIVSKTETTYTIIREAGPGIHGPRVYETYNLPVQNKITLPGGNCFTIWADCSIASRMFSACSGWEYDNRRKAEYREREREKTKDAREEKERLRIEKRNQKLAEAEAKKKEREQALMTARYEKQQAIYKKREFEKELRKQRKEEEKKNKKDATKTPEQ